MDAPTDRRHQQEVSGSIFQRRKGETGPFTNSNHGQATNNRPPYREDVKINLSQWYISYYLLM